MNRLSLILAVLSFALALIIFLLADGPRRWYSGVFFVVLGAVMLASAKRGWNLTGD